MKNSLENYAILLSDREDKILHNIRRETNLRCLMPRMLSSHLQGKFLEFISKMIKPAKILEIGTYSGYSAICLAKGLSEKGKLHTIELNDELEIFINNNIKKANLTKKIEIHIGNALKIIPTLNESFDLVFIDADKRCYLDYYKMIFNKIEKNGFIIVDNVFWSGKVFEKVEKNDLYTQGIINFIDFIKKDERIEQLTIPFRDGLMILRKK